MTTHQARAWRPSPLVAPMVALAALFGAFTLAPSAIAQGDTPAAGSYEPPRLKSGKPDFHGVWSNASVTRLERPAGYPLVLTREEADRLEGGALFNQRMKTESNFVDPNEGAPEKGKPLPGVGNYDVAYTDPGAHVASINGELRSSFITYPENGKVPAMTDDGRKLRASMPRRVGNGFDNPEERGLSERCIIIGNAGPPLGQYLYNNNFQIVQTDDHLMLLSEMIHDVRVARIGGKHRAGNVEQWHGDSIAWWEGDTLVVETRGLNGKQWLDHGGFPASDKLTVVEKFRRPAFGRLEIEVTITDPTYYTRPWTATITSARQINTELFEFICNENEKSRPHMIRPAAGSR
jgi:hypothetical protein